MQFRHRDIPLKQRATRINRLQVVEASNIPLEERDWTCPFCPLGLPKLAGYHQKQQCVRHHYDTAHKRRDTSYAATRKARAKQRQNNKRSQPFLTNGYARATAKRIAAQNRDMNIGDHQLQQFAPDWPTWPYTKHTGKPPERRGFLFTCQKCLRIGLYQKKSWLIPCKGTAHKPVPQERQRWEQLKDGNRQKLLSIWGLTKRQADRRFEKLVEDGIEPHPGPSSTQHHNRHTDTRSRATQAGPTASNHRQQPNRAEAIQAEHTAHYRDDSISDHEFDEDDDDCEEDDPDPHDDHNILNTKHRPHKGRTKHTAHILSINTRGAPGVHKLLQLIPTIPASIICIQECSLATSEFNYIQRQFATLGYNAYYAAGQHTTKPTGGVVTAVHKHIPHKLTIQHAGGESQHLIVDLGHWMLVNSYIPPRPHIRETEQQTLLSLLHSSAIMAGHRPWIATGDYNMLPNEMQPLMDQVEGHLVHADTRWQQHRQIDHIWSNWPDGYQKQQTLAYKLSDHKLLSIEVQLRWKQATHRCTIQQSHRWSVPPGWTTKQWQAHLANTWPSVPSSDLDTLLQTQAEQLNAASIDNIWHSFNLALHTLYQQAAAAATPPAPPASHAFHIWQQQAAVASPKPLEPRLQWISSRTRRSYGSMRDRKNANWLARATRYLELQDFKHTQLSQQQHDARQAEATHLLRKLHLDDVQRRNPAQFNNWLQTQIHRKEHRETEKHQQLKQHRIQLWQSSVRNNPTARYKWTRRGTQGPTPTVQRNNTDLVDDQEVLDAIHHHWQAIWNDARSIPEQTKQSIVLNTLPTAEPAAIQPTQQDFDKVKQSLGGAPGPDDWTAEELQNLPTEVTHLFHKITQQWESTGYIPTALTYSRQVNIAKQHKIHQGRTDVSHLRPINIYSLFYRWWSSLWAKSPALQQWRHSRFPEAIAGGPASPGTEALASRLNDSLQSQGFLATLDCSLAFDYTSPLAATSALRQLGLPFDASPLLSMEQPKANNPVEQEFLTNSVEYQPIHPAGGPTQPAGTQCPHVGRPQLRGVSSSSSTSPTATHHLHGRPVLYSSRPGHTDQHHRSVASLQHANRSQGEPAQSSTHHSKQATAATATSFSQRPCRPSTMSHTFGLHPWNLHNHQHNPRPTTKGKGTDWSGHGTP